jgi:hypothetical protein
MCFHGRFYVVVILYFVAQQNTSFGWGRISSIELGRFDNFLLKWLAINQLNRINKLNTNIL